MGEEWLPRAGTITPLDDGELVVRRAQDDQAFRITVAAHRCAVAPVEALPDNAILLPAEGAAEPPVFANGDPIPPFDEAPILAGLPFVARATASGHMALANSPFGERSIFYEFRDGQLRDMQLVPAIAGSAAPGRAAPDGLDMIWSADWDRWRLWRAGTLSGEQFLEGATVQGLWPYLALVQGIFEHDTFVDERRLLPAPSDALALLRLVQW